jgi:hypothetical protein
MFKYFCLLAANVALFANISANVIEKQTAAVEERQERISARLCPVNKTYCNY